MSETIEQIIQTEYSELMQKSYIDYAMSVIVARALPDVRDGLKPVQRRTLYDMYELGIRYDRPYRKSARIVGDTMGKYHPHGDSSIYGSLVVMAQEFKYGMPLVDGHGNFGSIEGDGAAAMRYTEARLEKLTQEVYLADLDKEVVDFIPNFDATEEEPGVLPVRVPNILINGAEGIAVGMATSIPPHNLGEVIDGVIALMKNPDITTKELLESIEGPDFPTGGIIINKDELVSIYESGNGKIRLRGKVEIEKKKGGKENLVITEIPYTMVGANIGKFLNDVFALVENKTTTDIVDISNQSSKDGIRIVLELRKGTDTENLCNLLYKKTRLEDTFGVNMLAVAKGKPETLGLKAILKHHIEFQYSVNTRKYEYLLKKEIARREIQEGLMKAIDVIDLIIEILRGSKNIKQAKECLIYGTVDGIRFKTEHSKKQAGQLSFTERQATAILEMRLYRLIALELESLQKAYEETVNKITLYEKLLGSRAQMAKAIIKDLTSIRKEYAVARKTLIDNKKEAIYVEKGPDEMEVVVLMDRFGYVKTIDTATFERNKEAAVSENKRIISCRNTDRLLLFSNKGKLHMVKVMDLPFGKFRDKGTPIDNLCSFSGAEETLLFVASYREMEDKKILFATKTGMVKLVQGDQFDVLKKSTMATKLADGDEVLAVRDISQGTTLVLQSEKQYFLRIDAELIPEKKKTAIGVRGMKLSGEDRIQAAYVLNSDAVLSVTVREKEIQLNRLHIANRDTKGVKK